jgi:predicted dehydrogenase
VFTHSYLKHDWAKYDESRIELEADNGMSTIMVSYSGNRYAAEVEIFGSEGSLFVDLQSMLCIKKPIRENLNPLKLAKQSLYFAGDIVGGLFNNTMSVATGRFRVGHEVVIEQFVDSLLNGTKLPVTAEEGRETVRVVGMITDRLKEKYGY